MVEFLEQSAMNKVTEVDFLIRAMHLGFPHFKKVNFIKQRRQYHSLKVILANVNQYVTRVFQLLLV